MVRELVIGSVIGTVGLGALILGVQGYFNPEAPLLSVFSDRNIAMVAIVTGLLGCMAEVRIMAPALRSMAKQQSNG